MSASRRSTSEGGTRGMTVSEASRKVVAGVAGMAHALRLDIVIEGVESADQAQLAGQLGIDYAQGYFFGRPEPLEDALARLASPT